MRKVQTLLIERVKDETRLAVIEDSRLMELYVQRPGMENLTGNIYLGRVEHVLPGMSAAFVALGMEKNGYLAAGDIAAPAGDAALASALRNADPLKRARPGQAMLVQAVKSQPGGKGPRLSGHITLPGRLMALLTDVLYVGVSRKIADQAERERLHGLGRELMGENGPGMILRTAVALEPLIESDFSEESAELPLSPEDEERLRAEEEAKKKDHEQQPAPSETEPAPEGPVYQGDGINTCMVCGLPCRPDEYGNDACAFGGCTRFFASFTCMHCGENVPANTCHTCTNPTYIITEEPEK